MENMRGKQTTPRPQAGHSHGAFRGHSPQPEDPRSSLVMASRPLPVSSQHTLLNICREWTWRKTPPHADRSVSPASVPAELLSQNLRTPVLLNALSPTPTALGAPALLLPL